jgi:hypothetical protein
MSVPVVKSRKQRLRQFCACFKPAAFKSQRFELLPPGLNQIQPAGISGNEKHLYLRPCQQSQLGLTTMMSTQIVLDNQQAVSGKLCNDLFKQADMAGAVASVTQNQRRLPGCWFKCTMHPQCATSPIIWLKSSTMGTGFPFFTRISFGRQRPQLINADDTGIWQRSGIGTNYRPLFSTKSGSWVSASWNQLCCRFQSSPSSRSHSQIVESDRWTPSRSSNAVCNRSNVHNSKGYPSVRGFCSTRSSNLLRTPSEWVGGRPGRGLSSNPASPSSLKRLTQWIPDAAFLYPANRPALAAPRPGSSSNAWITRARCTSLIGAFRDFNNRFSSSFSAFVNVLICNRFGIFSDLFSGQFSMPLAI